MAFGPELHINLNYGGLLYIFGVLHSDKSKEADWHNDGLLGPATLGIEIFDSVYAGLCGLGVINHQIRGGKEISAAEVALDWPLPPEGFKVVTQRPDKDSFLGMSVLDLRAEGKEREISKLLVVAAGGLDITGTFKRYRKAYPELVEAFPDGLEIKALNAITRNVGRINVAERITDIKRILTGRASRLEMQQIVKLFPRTFKTSFETEVYGEITFIEASETLDDARFWADHQEISVAIIFDRGRYSIMYKSECFNGDGFEIAINLKEASKREISLEELALQHGRWGGHRGRMINSPSGAGYRTHLSKVEVIQTAYEFVSATCSAHS